jgi:transmembrane sensor
MRKQWWFGSIIAVLMVLLAALGAMEWNKRSAHEPLGVNTERVLTTEVGQQRQLTLESGLNVVLNTQTSLAMQDLSAEFDLELRSGEVLVDTTSKPAKRLRVRAGPATLETTTPAKFSIHRVSDDESVVQVFAGELAIRPDASFMTVKLQSGQSATLGPRKLTVDRFTPETALRLLSWTKGKLIFDGDSLASVVSELNRYNRQQIVIADDSLAQFRIGGSYSATNPVGFAKALEATFGIRAMSIRSGGRGASVVVLSKPATAKSKALQPLITRADRYGSLRRFRA